ncbi:WXG100 family type VII secretion target [Streptomyces sp. DSM 44917]|uniref:WXG100 family type VII secretion target n=1 Tax=Streptomyces boetiae TaxID=3075541 RepID=A0ABU2LFH4_9ACTN|nr:WXG100 family type VII secretion target [Streptomyces sp. DSM 44917]MDT0310326.1 WXG100 family type VII secretion target [Streptomyces sp. DSM 44917]
MAEETAAGSGITYTSAELRRLVGRLREATTELDQVRTQATTAGDTFAASWVGQAGTSAHTLQTRAVESLRELRESVGTIADLLEMSVDGFDATEQEQVARLARIADAQDGQATTIPGF